jgi:YbgC/YbaW family acyl-CoA thioester hydrolase
VTPPHEIEIRWADLDGFGHASHRAYVDFLEEARGAFLDGLIGAEHRRALTIRRLAIDYLAQLTQADDRVRVTVRIETVDGASVTTAEEVFSAADGRLAARATCQLETSSTATMAALDALEAPAQHG